MVAALRESRARAAALADGTAPPALLAAVERVRASVVLGPDTSVIVSAAAAGVWARGIDGRGAEDLSREIAAEVQRYGLDPGGAAGSL